MSDYDLCIVDATNQIARARYAAQSGQLPLDPVEQLTYRKLSKKPSDELTDEEREKLNELEEVIISMNAGLAIHIFFHIILTLSKKFDYKTLVLAWDKGSWRYKEFEGYKKSRKDAREKESDFEVRAREKYYQIIDELIDRFNDTKAINLHVDYCEADDIAGVLALHVPGRHLVVTSDSDYWQLLANPLIDVYDPIKKKMIKLSPDEARYQLFEKIIRGDSSDSIPSAWPRIRKTRIQKMFEDDQEFVQAMNENNEFMKSFERNRKLIDFAQIPSNILLSVLREFSKQQENSNPRKFDRKNWLDFLKRHKLVTLLDDLREIRGVLYDA